MKLAGRRRWLLAVAVALAAAAAAAAVARRSGAQPTLARVGGAANACTCSQRIEP